MADHRLQRAVGGLYFRRPARHALAVAAGDDLRRQPHRLADADHRRAAAGFAVLADGNHLAWLERDRLPRVSSVRPSPFTWYAEAVQRIGATRSAAFINLVPVSAVILGAVLLDERLGVAVLSGGAGLVIAGVIITNHAGARLAAGVISKEKTA
jgi:hypothetical protein